MKNKYVNDANRQANNFINLANKAKENNSLILVFVHRSVDGDCVGSACGTVDFLRHLGAKAYVAMPEELPENMEFMEIDDYLFFPFGDNEMAEEFKSNNSIGGSKYDISIAVDCSAGFRMGPCGEIFDSCEETYVIDHHASVEARGDNLWIDPDASSASELCYYNVCAAAQILGKPVSELLSKTGAKAFLTGMVTDTGRFSYTNVNSETLIASGELMELGGTINDVCYNLFDRTKRCSFQVSSEARLRTEFYKDNRIALTTVPREIFEKYGAGDDAVDEVSSKLRDIDGVDVAIVIRELKDGSVRVNLRSTENFDSRVLAEAFNGGGHVRASGISIKDAKIEDIKEKILEEAYKQL